MYTAALASGTFTPAIFVAAESFSTTFIIVSSRFGGPGGSGVLDPLAVMFKSSKCVDTCTFLTGRTLRFCP